MEDNFGTASRVPGQSRCSRTDRGRIESVTTASEGHVVPTRKENGQRDPYVTDTDHAYDVHPNGDQFVFVKTGSAQLMVVVLNWLEELKAKVGESRRGWNRWT